MILKNIQLKQFRNVENTALVPCETLNILWGNNAEGKTNLLEAIFLFNGEGSFRNSLLKECIMFEKDNSQLKIIFEDREREQTAELAFSNSSKKIKVNNVEIKKSEELSEIFYAVVFAPTHLSFIKDGPKERRKFLDFAIEKINTQYRSYLSDYEKILAQRNFLLKSSYMYPNIKEDIEVWDEQLAKIGTIISIYRKDYIEKLYRVAKKIYDGISGEKEEFFIRYSSTVFEKIEEIKNYEEKSVEIYINALKESFYEDIKQGFTSVGIHRDDIEILIDKKPAKGFASQGQQRSSIIAIKLGEASLIRKVKGENPIILLDDVMSELDIKRQEYILNHVKDMQVFITCCDVNQIESLKNGKLFHIKNGEVVEEKEIRE